jgi:bacteriocin biosynthesis cyclodehydratase domain-containing protein
VDSRRRRSGRCGRLLFVPTPRTLAHPRLLLRPGLHVLRRSSGELQVGLDPRHAVVLDDDAEARALLDRLRTGATDADPSARDRELLRLLADSGLLVDADTLLPLIPTGAPTPAGAAPRTDVAALAAVAGAQAAPMLELRAAGDVELVHSGNPLSRALVEQLGSLLTAVGVHPRAPVRSPGTGCGATLAVLVTVGEPEREYVDGWVREGTPHLLLRFTEGHATLGPYVVPGRTACLRCVDAHHTDTDPAWPLLVRQYAAASARTRDDTVPEPVDTLLAALAVAWTAREVTSALEGRGPGSLSTTIRLDPHLTALETQAWSRHPGCGCAWA